MEEKLIYGGERLFSNGVRGWSQVMGQGGLGRAGFQKGEGLVPSYGTGWSQVGGGAGPKWREGLAPSYGTGWSGEGWFPEGAGLVSRRGRGWSPAGGGAGLQWRMLTNFLSSKVKYAWSLAMEYRITKAPSVLAPTPTVHCSDTVMYVVSVMLSWW